MVYHFAHHVIFFTSLIQSTSINLQNSMSSLWKVYVPFLSAKREPFFLPECVFLLILLPPGRSWKASELRLKSWDDLQKLWYVLLKEKNMLMTQRQMLHAQNFRFPNPERLPKVYPIFFACILMWACHWCCSELLKSVALYSCTDNDLNNLALQTIESLKINVLPVRKASEMTWLFICMQTWA